jgi:UDP-glucose 4-epimerase
MKAAILGVNGYIGRHLAHCLLQQGYSVQGYDIAEFPALPGLPYVQLDVRDRHQFGKLNEGFDLLFYFSGITGTIKGYEDYETYIDVNEKGLLHLLDTLRRQDKPPRVVFPSTRLVYNGIKGTPLAEDAEKEFKTLYALNKWFAENLLQQYAAYFGISHTIFRICVPYGNLLDKAYSYGTVGFFLGRAVAGNPIRLYGTGEQKRTFTHVEDVCRQIYYALQHPSSLNTVFNIAGETFSLKEIADAIGHKFAVSVDLAPWPEIDAKLESGDTIFDAGRIEKCISRPLKNNFHSWLQTIA